MCFQQESSKSVLKVSGIFLLTLGTLILTLGIINTFFLAQNESYLNQYDYNFYIGRFFIIIGFSTITLGLLSYLGSKGETQTLSQCGLIFFGGIAFGIVFSVSIISLSWINISQQYLLDPRTCNKVDFLRQTHRLYQKSQEILCTRQCPCSLNTELYDNYSNIIDNLESSSYNINTKNIPINIMGCEQYPDIIKRLGWNSQNNYTYLATGLEVIFQCAGICQKGDYYIFSDINKGFPIADNSCFDDLMLFINKYGIIIALSSWLLAIFIIIMILASCQICLRDMDDDIDSNQNQVRRQRRPNNGYQPIQVYYPQNQNINQNQLQNETYSQEEIRQQQIILDEIQRNNERQRQIQLRQQQQQNEQF